MFLLTLLAACSTPDPDPCDDMCAAGAALYGDCLEEWGVDWPSAGYADEADYLDACQTWAWEMRVLEADAAQRGATDDACVARAADFDAPDATCDDFTAVDWSEPTW